MTIVGITGGIGSGKSVACSVFQHLGIPVYDADSAVHHLYENSPELIEKIKKEISEDVIDKNGKLIRKKLGEIVFNDESKLKKLNAIVHPLVKTDFEKWVSKNKGYPYLIKEAAILFESGANEGCDKVIVVYSPVELRITRIRERDHKSRADVEQIISKQIDEDELIKKSDFVIVNDEKKMMIPQILKIHATLLK